MTSKRRRQIRDIEQIENEARRIEERAALEAEEFAALYTNSRKEEEKDEEKESDKDRNRNLDTIKPGTLRRYSGPSSYMRRYLGSLAPGTIFATRDLLCFAKRTTVDSFLARMLNENRIERLTPGIYRTRPEKQDLVKEEEIVRAKLRAFGLESPGKLLNKIDRTSVYLTSGNNSSLTLTAKAVKVELKKIGPRKLALGQSRVGAALRGFWLQGKSNCKEEDIAEFLMTLGRNEKIEIAKMKRLLPQWLIDRLPSTTEAIMSVMPNKNY